MGAPVDDLEKGYHETMTQAWVRLVHLTLSDCGVAESADAFCDQQPQLMQKTRLQLFYSRTPYDLEGEAGVRRTRLGPNYMSTPRPRLNIYMALSYPLIDLTDSH